jgi:hypothetical protein
MAVSKCTKGKNCDSRQQLTNTLTKRGQRKTRGKQTKTLRACRSDHNLPSVLFRSGPKLPFRVGQQTDTRESSKIQMQNSPTGRFRSGCRCPSDRCDPTAHGGRVLSLGRERVSALRCDALAPGLAIKPASFLGQFLAFDLHSALPPHSHLSSPLATACSLL